VDFIWDPAKATINVRKHGVTFSEASTVFYDPLAIYLDDARHHDRAIIIGQCARGRLLFTVFVDVDLENEIVRIISARRATKPERRKYEQR